MEEKVNEWLRANPVNLDTMKTELSTVVVDDEGINEYWLEHVLIIFYVPMMPISSR